MTAKELIEKAASQAVSFFEKAAEMRFFLHVFCVVMYLDIGFFVVYKKPIVSLTWGDIEHLSPGMVIGLVLCYFSLMGYVFRLLYAFVNYSLGWLSIMYLSPNKTHWRDIPGMVYSTEVERRAYLTKDNELTRQLESHRELCKQDRKEMKEFAYLAFSAIALIIISKALVTGSIMDEAKSVLSPYLSNDNAHTLGVFLALPLAFLVWLDASDDCSRGEYLRHDALYQEIEEEKRKEREKRQ